MLDSTGQCLSEVAPSELDTLDSAGGEAPALRRHAGSGSGGYADHIFMYAADQLFGESDTQLTYKNLR